MGLFNPFNRKRAEPEHEPHLGYFSLHDGIGERSDPGASLRCGARNCFSPSVLNVVIAIPASTSPTILLRITAFTPTIPIPAVFA